MTVIRGRGTASAHTSGGHGGWGANLRLRVLAVDPEPPQLLGRCKAHGLVFLCRRYRPGRWHRSWLNQIHPAISAHHASLNGLLAGSHPTWRRVWVRSTQDPRLPVSDGLLACAGMRLQACTEPAAARRHAVVRGLKVAVVAGLCAGAVDVKASCECRCDTDRYRGKRSRHRGAAHFASAPTTPGWSGLHVGNESQQQADRLSVSRRLHPVLCSPATRYGAHG